MGDGIKATFFQVPAQPSSPATVPSPKFAGPASVYPSQTSSAGSPAKKLSIATGTGSPERELEAGKGLDMSPVTPLPEEFRPGHVPVASFPSLADTSRVAIAYTAADYFGENRSSISSVFEAHRDDILNKEKDIDAICVNCQEYISLTDVDDHSYMCFLPSYQDTDAREEVALRVKKLHRAVNKRLREAKGDKLMILMRLREVAVEVTRNAEADVRRLELELEDLAITSIALDGGLCCSLLARRLGNLIAEKELETSEKGDNEQFVTHFSQDFERQKQELLSWRGSPVPSPEKKALAEVKSDIGSDNASAASRSSALIDSDIADIASAEEGLRLMTENQLKKYFYGRCLKQKLLLPKSHPAQKVLVSGLFEEVRRRELPVSQWDQFIRDSLQCSLV